MNNLYRWLNFYPPFIGAGIRVTQDDRDPHTMVVRMRLTRLNKNVYGTH